MGRCVICKEIFKGRSDKKFCSVGCKNNYHAKLQKASDDYTTRIDKLLHRNHKILMVIMGKSTQQKKVSRAELVKVNFNFDYVTGYYQNSQNKIYHYVYDFAWMAFSSQEILIVRNQKSLLASEAPALDKG